MPVKCRQLMVYEQSCIFGRWGNILLLSDINLDVISFNSMPFIIFFLFLPQLSSFSLHSAISLHLLDWQELSQRQTMLMNRRCVSINVFLSPSWWESYIAANFVLGSFIFIFPSSILGLGDVEGKWFQHLSNTFLSDCLGGIQWHGYHSQEAQSQPEKADKGHWKTIHSDYVGTHKVIWT